MASHRDGPPNCGCRIEGGAYRPVWSEWARREVMPVNPEPIRRVYCERHAHLADTVDVLLYFLRGSR